MTGITYKTNNRHVWQWVFFDFGFRMFNFESSRSLSNQPFTIEPMTTHRGVFVGIFQEPSTHPINHSINQSIKNEQGHRGIPTRYKKSMKNARVLFPPGLLKKSPEVCKR
jgi:hypothetical protein